MRRIHRNYNRQWDGQSCRGGWYGGGNRYGSCHGLIKATSIVGYIAVQDLTKMGDIVRSRTYEAFFPLIAVTVIYFLLEGLIGFLISRIQINMDPKRRSEDKILEGVTKR